MFLQLSTQWRVLIAGMGGVLWQGLRYDIAILLMQEASMDREARQATLDDLRLMEAVALGILNERDD